MAVSDLCGSSSVSPILPSALVNVGRGGHLSERNAPNIGAIATVSTTSATVSVATEDDEDNNTSIGQPLDATISAKRRRSVLTLEQKLEIIKRAKKGERVTKLASEYGVGKATVSDLKRQEEKIMAFVARLATDGPKRRKTMRKPHDERVEKAMHLWLNQEKRKGTTISGPLLKEKAMAFHRQLHGDTDDSFKASTGWLHRFKVRNGIRHQKTPAVKKATQEPGDSDAQNVQTLLERLRGLLRQNAISPEQLYTADKSQLFWRAMPRRGSPLSASDKASGAEPRVPKHRISLMVCANATGSHRLRVVLAGRHKNIGSGTQLNSSKLPYRYMCQEDAWVDASTFCEWFYSEFVPNVRTHLSRCALPANALLLVDNCQIPVDVGVLQSDDGAIRCIMLPPSLAFLTQPITSGIFETLKRRYRKKLVHHALALHSSSRKRLPLLSELGHTVRLKDAAYMLSDAWETVSAECLQKLWRDTLFCLGAMDEQALVVEELLQKVDDQTPSFRCSNQGSLVGDAFEIADVLKELDKGLTEEDVANWLSMDTDDPSDAVLTDQQIVESVRSASVKCEYDEDEQDEDQMYDESESEDADDEDVSPPVPSDEEAHYCFGKCLLWLESQPECDPNHLRILWQLQNSAAHKRRAKR